MNPKEIAETFLSFCQEFINDALAPLNGRNKAEEYEEILKNEGCEIQRGEIEYIMHPTTETKEKYVEIILPFFLYERATETLIYTARATLTARARKDKLTAEISKEDESFLKAVHIKIDNTNRPQEK